MLQHFSFSNSTAIDTSSVDFKAPLKWSWELDRPIELPEVIQEQNPQEIKVRLIDDKLFRLVEKEPVPQDIEVIDSASFASLLDKIK